MSCFNQREIDDKIICTREGFKILRKSKGCPNPNHCCAECRGCVSPVCGKE
jgi:hypothetical protein